MNDSVVIGYVCVKGPHPAFIGEDDYGACGSKAFAEIRVTVEQIHPNPRGQAYTAQDAADELEKIVAAAQAHGWCET